MVALLPILAHDIPWSAGGLMRVFDVVSEEGTLNNAMFPAAVSRGPIGPAWQTGTLVAECLSQMLDQTV
ncbi:hydantoinase B/oxoprolinase family protein, partial [Escherichia coli]|uniref:hydantoinase B/oxoprolinase family protein n=2 Tax=Bacteria TaxID=2 RepID=UPI0028E4C203